MFQHKAFFRTFDICKAELTQGIGAYYIKNNVLSTYKDQSKCIGYFSVAATDSLLGPNTTVDGNKGTYITNSQSGKQFKMKSSLKSIWCQSYSLQFCAPRFVV